MRKVVSIASILLIFAYCSDEHPASNPEGKGITKAISSMMDHISGDLASKGPAAWLNYFDSSSHFFMANNGILVFPDFEAGKKFINDTLVKMVQGIRLTFSNIKIDSLSETTASIAAKYHEDTKDMAGTSRSFDGYFTGLAVLTGSGWKLRNLHWSE